MLSRDNISQNAAKSIGNMKKILFAIVSAMLICGSAFAGAGITFNKKSHDFGTINEADGDVTCEFEVTNTGDAPLLLIRAVSSCGCTVPEFSKEPIRPGQKGIITVTYHAKGRPGPFTKSIRVYDNSVPNHVSQITITGNVLSSRNIEDDYSHQIGGGIRLKIKALNFFDVYPTKANRTRTLNVYNESDEPVQLTYRNVPKHILIQCEPEIIEPKKEGKVLITYCADKVKDWGMQKHSFELLVKGKETKMKDNRIMVTADIWEDFSELSKKERANAPVIEMSSRDLSFGECKSPKTITVTVKNTGKTKMIIRKIQNDMPNVFKTQLESEMVKPGGSVKLDVTFNPSECKMSAINHHITVISTDPANSRVIVNMNAEK